MIRKLAVWVLLIPLPLNGLWLVCRDAPPAEPQSPQASTNTEDSEDNLFSHFGELPNGNENSAGENMPEGSDCSRLCPIEIAAKTGALCLLTSDNKVSMTIVVFGVAVLPPAIHLQAPDTSPDPVPSLAEFYLNPAIDHSTPPPKA